jgi:iron complex outermembrane receptor protein
VRSRRPAADFGGEIDLQYGSNDLKQGAADVTGSITDWISGRLTGLYRDRESQVDHVGIERTYIAPALTFQLGSDTQLTLLYYYQKDEVLGETNGFLPAYGVSLPNRSARCRRAATWASPTTTATSARSGARATTSAIGSPTT